ncbi:MAG: SDR family NAD(P)-dependent oxidoreductase [Sorangiineae bacterium PRO1]|nr:SDR family NAD(P)-dependent oxidoreductase [Sorangiineae bacterium PRO1]
MERPVRQRLEGLVLRKERWGTEAIPPLGGKVAIVTGASSGIGLETARALAHRGARVVLACRNPEKARAAEREVKEAAPAPAAVLSLPLDLADLASVSAFADTFRDAHATLDLLVNNAGVMATPLQRTADGFEIQLGTNHLGHFALTGRLLDLLLAAPAARIVTVSSSMHRPGRIAFDDLQSERSYRPWRAYQQSKLANLLFTFELQRRLAGTRAIAVAAHPGYAATQLQVVGPRARNAALMTWAAGLGNRLFAQSAAMGALPSLYAAAAPGVRGGEFFGPGGLLEMRGHPRRVRPGRRARNEQVAARLWAASVELTGVGYEALS